jgi:rod shape-determining protein MreD
MGQLLISIPLFFIFSVIQSVAVSRIEIIAGAGDIVLLAIIAWTIIDEEGNCIGWGIIAGFMISLLSSMPLPATFAVYIICALTAKIAARVFWQSPILSLFLSVLIATIIKFFLEMITLQYLGISVPFILSVTSILFPTIVINLFFAFPIYMVMGDISRWISPKDEMYA